MKFVLFCLLCLLTACGYRPGCSPLSESYHSICIPYVTGDLDGLLTAALVHEITISLPFELSSTDGQLILIVKLLNISDENIGFRYDHLHHKHDRDDLVPIETRLVARAEVSLLNSATDCVVIPTVILSAFVDVDHEYNATYHDANVFSLGQLSDAEAAFDAARIPLFRSLSKKIADYIRYTSPGA